jgi:hypothetical protein
LSIVSSTRVFALLVMLPIIIRIFRGPASRVPTNNAPVGADKLDVWLIRFCPFIESIGFMLMGQARNTHEYIASGCLASFGGLGPPTLQSALTKHVAKEDVGRLLGALSLLGAISRVISPTILNLLYSFTVATCPQTVFYVLSGAMFIGLLLSTLVRPHGSSCMFLSDFQ